MESACGASRLGSAHTHSALWQRHVAHPPDLRARRGAHLTDRRARLVVLRPSLLLQPSSKAAADSRHRRLPHRSRCWHGLCAILDYASTHLRTARRPCRQGSVFGPSPLATHLPSLLPLPLLLSLRLRRLCSSSAAVVAAAQRESHILSPRAPRFRRPRLAAAAHARMRQEQIPQARQGSAFSSSLLW